MDPSFQVRHYWTSPPNVFECQCDIGPGHSVDVSRILTGLLSFKLSIALFTAPQKSSYPFETARSPFQFLDDFRRSHTVALFFGQ